MSFAFTTNKLVFRFESVILIPFPFSICFPNQALTLLAKTKFLITLLRKIYKKDTLKDIDESETAFLFMKMGLDFTTRAIISVPTKNLPITSCKYY